MNKFLIRDNGEAVNISFGGNEPSGDWLAAFLNSQFGQYQGQFGFARDPMAAMLFSATFSNSDGLVLDCLLPDGRSGSHRAGYTFRTVIDYRRHRNGAEWQVVFLLSPGAAEHEHGPIRVFCSTNIPVPEIGWMAQEMNHMWKRSVHAGLELKLAKNTPLI